VLGSRKKVPVYIFVSAEMLPTQTRSVLWKRAPVPWMLDEPDNVAHLALNYVYGLAKVITSNIVPLNLWMIEPVQFVVIGADPLGYDWCDLCESRV
jgi:hypothetical protein